MRKAWFVVGAVAASTLAVSLVPLARTLSAPAAPEAAMAPPRFVDEAARAGLDHVYDGDWEYFVGGGVAVLDCDLDGRLDLYLAGGANEAALYRNTSATGDALRFTHLADPATDLTAVTGAYALNVDGDGVADLAVLRHGENVLLRGLGDCRFEPANEPLGFDGGDAWTTAFSAMWEGRADLPTLAFGNYVEVGEDGDRVGTCHDNVLVRPAEDATGYAPPASLTPGRCSLSMLFSDWDRSGRRDLRVTNDRHYYRDGEEQLWRIDEREPRAYTRDDGWQKLEIWGMGIASHDVTGDGYPEVFLTSQGDNKLQTLAAGADRPTYTDIAIRRGATVHRPYAGDDQALPSTAWHAEFQDVNNDGFVDLFVAKGNVEEMPDHAAEDPNNLLLGQSDGTFAEAADAAGIVTDARARGAALADLNLDGMLDLVVVNRRVGVELWRNVGWGAPDEPAPMGNWLAVTLRQPHANPDAVGAWVEARIGDHTMRREVTVGGGHASGQLGSHHLGLADADRVDIRVQWPDGTVGPWSTVRANQHVVVERGVPEPRPAPPLS